jgi:Holliday junction DNA helicase RuvA
MIAKLSGILDEKNNDAIIIDVLGVGYKVFMPRKIIQNLPPLQEKITIYIAHIIKQDDQILCGFSTSLEKKWFELLITVQGVGTKVALSILSCLSIPELENALLLQDALPLKEAEGVGLKVANRIVMELKNKIPEHDDFSMRAGNKDTSIHTAIHNDAIQALTQLGYVKNHVSIVVKDILKDDNTITESDLIKRALQKLHN